MRRFRGQLALLVPAVMALFVLRLAEPRPGLYFHQHAGGDHAHAHAESGATHDWESSFLALHLDSHSHPHSHPHPHEHGLSHTHQTPVSTLSSTARQPVTPALPVSFTAGPRLLSAGEHAATHWHTQSVFDRSLARSGPAVLVVRRSEPLADALPIPVGARPLPQVLARGPPALAFL